MLIRIYNFLQLLGFNPIKFYKSLIGFPKYFNDLRKLKKSRGFDKTFKFGKSFPILNEWNESAGIASGHYFHQDLFVSQLIYDNNPIRHIDIGSRIDGFVAHVAAFRKIEIIDIRNIDIKLRNIEFTQSDLLNLQEQLIESCDSLSCLHALEHFGLGRYGDPIDYFGFIKGFKNISCILKVGGSFYFSVPIGEQRIEFNAHRVFSIAYLLEIISPKFEIKSFSFVNDKGNFYPRQLLNDESISSNFGCTYGCGIFELIKK